MKDPYLLDCYKKEFTAKVNKVINDRYIVLDSTYFYPTGGGQPHDLGTIATENDTYNVTFVKKTPEGISHEVDKPGLKEGDQITGKIDWKRRYKHMRYHTGIHILSHVIHSKTGAMITGNQLTEEKARVDFNIKDYDKEKVAGYVEETNKLLAENHPIKLSIVPKEEAKEILGEKFTTLAKGFSEDIKEIRIVDVQGIAKEACGGTHIANTQEIGQFTFVKAENKGKGNRRVVVKLNE